MSASVLIYHPESLRHVLAPGHVESPLRLKAILAKFESLGLLHEVETPAAASRADVRTTHSSSYVDLVETFGDGYLDADTPIHEETASLALLAVGGALHAALASPRTGRPRPAPRRPAREHPPVRDLSGHGPRGVRGRRPRGGIYGQYPLLRGGRGRVVRSGVSRGHRTRRAAVPPVGGAGEPGRGRALPGPPEPTGPLLARVRVCCRGDPGDRQGGRPRPRLFRPRGRVRPAPARAGVRGDVRPDPWGVRSPAVHRGPRRRGSRAPGRGAREEGSRGLLGPMTRGGAW